MILTEAQKITLRKRPHATKLWLSVYQPTTILACQVNDGAISKGEREITFDNTSEGSYLLVQSGMTLFVGSSAGAFDKGTVRVRSSTSTVLTVAENSHINWANDDYLTVVNFYEINAIYPRIIQDPADDENTLWYKDYDIEYTDQNTVLGSFINMGSHYAGFVEDDIFYSASGTHNLREDTLSYHWFFEGGSPTGSSSHTPGNVSYSTPGHYTTRLIVSGTSTGAVDTSYRHVSIYDRPGEGSNTPIEKWQFSDLSGSRDQGGYTARITLRENVDDTILKDGSLIVIFSDDYYGDLATPTSLGGNALGRQKTFFVGYVIQGSIEYNYRDSMVEFEVGSPTEIMKLAEGFAISIRDSADPSTATSDPNIPSSWVTVLGMDTRRALYHYLKWHSTVLLTTDVEFVGTDRPLQYFDSDRTSLYNAVDTAMRSILVGKVVNDRQGKLWLERDIYIEPDQFNTTLELDNRDWMGSIDIDERHGRLSFIEMGGIAYSGAVTGTYSALLSQAPGVAPAYRGSLERQQGLALIDQDELNGIVGAVYAQRNAQYPNVSIDFSGNYRNFDVAPQEKIPLTVDSSDTVRGLTFSSKNFFPDRMEWAYNPEIETLLPRISLVELTTGFDGDTIVIPEVSDVVGGGFNVPSITIPPIIPPTLPVAAVGGGANIATYPKQVFVPVTSLYDDTDNTELPLNMISPNQGPSIAQLLNGRDMGAAGSFMIPPNYSGYVTIYPIGKLSNTTGGNAFITWTVDFYDKSETYFSNNGGDGDTLSESIITESGAIQIFTGTTQAAYPERIFGLNFYREGGHASDTFNGNINFIGWYIEYG